MRKLLLLSALVVFLTSCGGGGGGGGESGPSVPAPQNITVSLTSSADSAEVNSSITLTWSSTLATSCSASGAWSGSKGTSGSESITIGVGGSNTFSLSCAASGANSGSASTTVNGLRYFDGKVFDGYIRGAEVFVDTNDNLTLDANEASVSTDNAGSFTKLLFGNGTLVSKGGFDLDTGADLSDLTLVHKLEGYEASKLASPFTTLIAYMTNASNINAALGIDASINLLTTDPIPNLGEGIYDQMYEKGNQLTVLSYTLQNQAAADSSQLYFEAIADQLEESYAANQVAVDIEDPTFISNVIDKAETASATTLSPDVKANLNTVLSSSIPLLKVYADSSTTASVQRFTFSTLQNDVQDSAVIGSSTSTTIAQYNNNVFEYVATDQGIDEAVINPINNNAPTISSSTTFSTAENQTSIGSISASDADGDSLTYSISGSEINISSSGVLTFATAPDYETKDSYTATVTVSDGTDSVTQSIVVSVTDVDETIANEAPTISSSTSFSVAENNTAIGSVTATDADGDSLTYSISGSEINISSSGVLTFATAPDYETKNSYTATVTVSDGTNSTTQNITVNVTDVDETDPNESPTISSSSTFSVAENQTAIGSVSASDADGDSLTYSISGSEINISSSGVLTFASAPDYETKNSYTATVTVSDGKASVTQSISINISNLNDNNPVISSSATFSLAENNTAIGSVTATDADEDSLTYSISGSEISISGIGQINFVSAPDYETKTSYTAIITVSDGTNSVTQSITVTITDVDETDPNESPTISSSTTFSSAENQTSIGSISASDADGDSLTYTISGSEINISSSGVLTFASAPNYETKNSYTATMTVSDGTASITQNITVNITDVSEAVAVNDTSSGIEDDNIRVDVLTNDTFSALDVTLTASDGSNMTVEVQNDATSVAEYGRPTIIYSPDANWFGTDSFTYTVSSGGESDQGTVTVTVTSVNDAPAISSSATFSAAENQTSIGSVTATDADGDSLTYSISGSEINISSSGVLSFAAAPDYETKNSYTATVTVSDGTASTTQGITVSITNIGGIYENGIAGAISTSWNKGVDFDKSGGNTFARVPEITNRYTVFSKSHSNSIATFQPWGTSITFKPDSTSTNQRLIQISSEDSIGGSGIQARVKDQGYLSIEGGAIKLRYRFLFDQTAAIGGTANVVQFTSNSILTTGNWYSLFIYFDGDNDQGGFGSSAFKIYLVNLNDGTLTDLSSNGTWVETLSINPSNFTFWNFEDYEIGSENFDGIIAAFSATTYKANELPSNDEIRTMALDPIKWLNDYKVNSTYRTVFNRNQDPIQSEAGVFSLNSDEQSYATQVFLMGDGGTDTASTIFNQVHTGGSANLSLINNPTIENISID